jgi:hypothetical protein
MFFQNASRRAVMRPRRPSSHGGLPEADTAEGCCVRLGGLMTLYVPFRRETPAGGALALLDACSENCTCALIKGIAITMACQRKRMICRRGPAIAQAQKHYSQQDQTPAGAPLWKLYMSYT